MSDSSGGWFLTHGDGEVHGPFELAALVEAAKQGRISMVTQLRHETHTRSEWLLASRIRPVAEVLSQRQETNVNQREQVTGSEMSGKSDPMPTSSQVATEPPAEPIESEAELAVKVRKKRQLGRGKDALIVPETFGAALLAIFDFRFRYFITPWIIRITWGFVVVIAVLSLVVFTIGFVLRPLVNSAESVSTGGDVVISDGLEGSVPRSRDNWQFQLPPWVSENLSQIVGYGALVLFYGLGLLYLRMFLEGAIVLFRIACDLSDLKDALKEK